MRTPRRSPSGSPSRSSISFVRATSVTVMIVSSPVERAGARRCSRKQATVGPWRSTMPHLRADAAPMAAVARQRPARRAGAELPRLGRGPPRRPRRPGPSLGGRRHHRRRRGPTSPRRAPESRDGLADWFEEASPPSARRAGRAARSPGLELRRRARPRRRSGPGARPRDDHPPLGRRVRHRRAGGRSTPKRPSTASTSTLDLMAPVALARQGRHRHRRLAPHPLHRCRRRVDDPHRRRRLPGRAGPRQG